MLEGRAFKMALSYQLLQVICSIHQAGVVNAVLQPKDVPKLMRDDFDSTMQNDLFSFSFTCDGLPVDLRREPGQTEHPFAFCERTTVLLVDALHNGDIHRDSRYKTKVGLVRD